MAVMQLKQYTCRIENAALGSQGPSCVRNEVIVRKDNAGDWNP